MLVFTACNNNNKLTVYGPRTAGKTTSDSLDYTVPVYTFVDQDSNIVDSNTVRNKIYVVDFFFTSCPSICPKMMKEMGLVYDKYKTNNEVAILSYSIDPRRDTVARLKNYEKKLGISASRWHLLTGDKDSIYRMADKYLVSAHEDPDAAGGFIHDGNFILMDKQNRIRGYYDGTKEDAVQKLMGDMDILLKEQPGAKK
jgi:protein SCO1